MYQLKHCLEKRPYLSLTKKATLIMEIFNMKKTAKKRYAIKLSAYESKKKKDNKKRSKK
jgi:hypothetical protein